CLRLPRAIAHPRRILRCPRIRGNHGPYNRRSPERSSPFRTSAVFTTVVSVTHLNEAVLYAVSMQGRPVGSLESFSDHSPKNLTFSLITKADQLFDLIDDEEKQCACVGCAPRHDECLLTRWEQAKGQSAINHRPTASCTVSTS